MEKKLIKTTVFRAGYQIKVEEWRHNDVDPPTQMRSAYNPSGHYIGTPRFARYLSKRGIVPELSDPGHEVCSIGYSAKDRKWYGWSHRAIYGFSIGTKVDDRSTIANKWAGKTIASLEEARQAAIDFAESVS